jgi:hypothetical protein
MRKTQITLHLKMEVPEKAFFAVPPPRDYGMWKKLLATCIDRALWSHADSDLPLDEKEFSDAEYGLLDSLLQDLRKET